VREIRLDAPDGGISAFYDKFPKHQGVGAGRERSRAATFNRAIVALRAVDFVVMWSMMLEPFSRTGRSPEIALKVLDLGKRVGRDVGDNIELPVDFDYTADVDREVLAFADEIEGSLETHILAQFARFHFGGFCTPVRLVVDVVDPDRQRYVPWLKSDPKDEDSSVRVRPKLAVTLEVLVNNRFGADLANLPIDWRTPTLSPWRGDRVQPISLFSWLVRGMLVAVVEQFVRKLGWHARLDFGPGYTQEDIDRDLSLSLLTCASDRDRGRHIDIRCVYVTDPTA